MSNPPDFTGAGKFPGRRAPEKSNFSHTCTLLSQYLKEKGSFGDLSLGMTCYPQEKGKSEMMPPTTLNLLTKLETSGQRSETEDAASDGTVKSMDLFPLRAGFVPSAAMEDAQKDGDLSARPGPAVAPQTAQMTIFYAGRVMLLNDFPADKAKEIMLLAGKCVLPNSGTASAGGNDSGNAHPRNSSFPSTSGNDCGNVFPRNSSFPSTPLTNPPEDRLQCSRAGAASDLPIARKASILRFLEKRKGRINSKAPYQANAGSPPASAGDREESKSWLGLNSTTD